jgi:hypothetical protein
MKKYLPGFLAAVCALALSAFTKPFTMLTFKLKHDPIAPGIVSNPANWTTGPSGQYFGDCSGPPEDLACAIYLDDSRTCYYHTENGEVILNTFAWANAQNPKQCYLEITEARGLHLGGGIYDYIISSIQPKRFNTLTQQFENEDLGADLSFKNACEVCE